MSFNINSLHTYFSPHLCTGIHRHLVTLHGKGQRDDGLVKGGQRAVVRRRARAFPLPGLPQEPVELHAVRHGAPVRGRASLQRGAQLLDGLAGRR